ncbi:hypothetical protein GTO27_06380, partial [Candidatus Bathyarchaeota archaeon]|nr:hypothetical protein [Candidatus Bathyarchaeota archaeon]
MPRDVKQSNNKGFTIVNGGYAGIYLPSASDSCTVEKNFFTENYHGIEADSDGNVIRNNIVINNSGTGIIIHGAFNRVEQNIIANHLSPGISLWLAGYNTIQKNIIRNNLGGGILLERSDNNDISRNLITKNEYVGIHLIESVYNSVMENLVINNSRTGIVIVWAGCNTVKGNIIVCNAYGISIGLSDENLVEGNIVLRNA